MDPSNIYLHTTHTFGNTTPTYTYNDMYGDLEWVRREDLVILYFPASVSWIRTFQLVVVADEKPDETDIWRPLPTRDYRKYVPAELESQGRPDITISLLLSRTFGYAIVPLSCLRSPNSSTGSNKNLQLFILYTSDKYKLDPQPDLTGSHFEFFFQCTGRYEPSIYSFDGRRRVSSIFISPLHSTSQRRVKPPLPARAICSIGRHLISDQFTIIDCARLLTSCALVCKTWFNSGVHDLLWPSFITKQSSSVFIPLDHFTRLVNCVERYPWIGERLQIFPCPLPARLDSDAHSAAQALYEPLVKSLPNLTTLVLLTSQWNAIRTYIPSLQYVEYLQLSRDHIYPGMPGKKLRYIDTYDMIDAINGWTRLNELRLEGWGLNLGPNAHLPILPPAYNLFGLTIRETYMQPSERPIYLNVMRHILSNSNPSSSSLQYLEMDDIRGLSNDDFKSIFSLVKSSIIELSVRECILNTSADNMDWIYPKHEQSPRKPQDPNSEPHTHNEGELAFDALVSSMPNLKYAGIHQRTYSNRIVSPLGILHKKVGLEGLFGMFDCRLSLFTPGQSRDGHAMETKKETIRHMVRELENALQYTGWKEVTVSVDHNDLEGCEYDLTVAKEIAVGRGVIFRFLGFWESSHP